MEQRNFTIDILKAFGIILMVVGHSKCPMWLNHYIYSFHMPMFFIISGMFLKESIVLSPLKFYLKKLKSLYVPFVCISLTFLLLHNPLLACGIYNDCYETSAEPYSRNVIVNLSKSIVFFMSGHDNDGFLGAFWFIRSLFVGSVLLCFLTNLLDLICCRFHHSVFVAVILLYIMSGLLRFFDYNIPYLPRGGYRELMAASFVGLGFLIRYYSIDHFFKGMGIPIWISFSILINSFHHPSLAPDSDILCWLLLPLSAFCGYATFYTISSRMKGLAGEKLLVFIGQNTWWIMSLHFLCFKLSMFIEVIFFDNDISIISSWPVDDPNCSYFFIIHVL